MLFILHQVLIYLFIIYRATELQNRTVDFQNGANLTDTDLDLDSTQALSLIQEAYDTF